MMKAFDNEILKFIFFFNLVCAYKSKNEMLAIMGQRSLLSLTNYE